MVAELVSALYSLEHYTILKGRGFEPGHCRSDKNELISEFYEIRNFRKLIHKPRLSGIPNEIDLLGGFCVYHAMILRRYM